jgi:hypothetical protein
MSMGCRGKRGEEGENDVRTDFFGASLLAKEW